MTILKTEAGGADDQNVAASFIMYALQLSLLSLVLSCCFDVSSFVFVATPPPYLAREILSM